MSNNRPRVILREDNTNKWSRRKFLEAGVVGAITIGGTKTTVFLSPQAAGTQLRQSAPMNDGQVLLIGDDIAVANTQ